jgi:DNA polymerase-1
LELHDRLQGSWEAIKAHLVAEVARDFPVFEGTTLKNALLRDFLDRRGIPWPRYESGSPILDDETFRTMARRFPELEPLRQLRVTLGRLRLHDLAIGRDGRNRTLLSPFHTDTGRNQPSSSRFCFGPARWIRGLIRPPEGYGIEEPHPPLALPHRPTSIGVRRRPA